MIHVQDLGRRAAGKLFLPLCLLLAGGCEADKYRRLPDPTPVNYNRPDIAKIMEEMDERRNSVETLVARLAVVLRDNVNKKEHGLSGAYIGDKDGNLRMRIKAEETVVLDLAIHGALVDLWLPRKGRFYRGERKDLVGSGANELALLANAGSVQDLFFPRAWTESAIERRVKLENGREVISVLERPGVFRRCVRRMTISREQPMADRLEVLDRTGRALGAIAYADFRFPGPIAGEKDPTVPSVPYPGRVTLSAPDGARSMQMDVEEMILNTPIPLTKYEIPVPEGQRILDLGAELRSGRSLWE